MSGTAWTGASSRENSGRQGAMPWPWLLPPLCAALYPWPLAVFHANFPAAGQGDVVAATAALLALSSAFLMPVLALAVAARLMDAPPSSPMQLRARRVALFSVTAPALFVVTGVFTYVAGHSALDQWLLGAFWIGMTAFVALGDRRPRSMPAPRVHGSRLRTAHGIAAAFFLLVFLAWHFGNHLLGLLGGEAHRAAMRVLRQVYRAPAIEPLVVAAALFLVVSGLVLAWRAARRPAGFIGTLQLITGLYLAVAIPSHVNSVLYFARTFLKIESDWDFAIGAPTGLLADPWNIRLVPYYAWAVAAVVIHAFCGLRLVMLAHGVAESTCRRVVAAGSVFGLLLATAIMLGMCGVRL